MWLYFMNLGAEWKAAGLDTFSVSHPLKPKEGLNGAPERWCLTFRCAVLIF